MIAIRITIAFIICVILYFALIKTSTSEYYEYIDKLKTQLKNKELSKLMNAQLMDNLPNINLFVNNNHKNDFIMCSPTNAVYLRDVPDNLTEDDIDTANHKYDSQCSKICNSTASGKAIIIIDEMKQQVFINNKQLHSGIWCITERPECNLKTTYAVMTINGNIVCRSKFPNLFGGPTGDKIIACNNKQYYHPDNKLIDNQTGDPVDPRGISITDEDEMIIDPVTNREKYRFNCQFAKDEKDNLYTEHPLNRFHPLRNPCAIAIPKAGDDAPKSFNSESGECDCTVFGRPEIKNKGSNKNSICTGCWNKFDLKEKQLQIESDCFVFNDSAQDARHKLPCVPDEFTKNRTRCDIIKLNMFSMTKLLDENDKPVSIFTGDIYIG